MSKSTPSSPLLPKHLSEFYDVIEPHGHSANNNNYAHTQGTNSRRQSFSEVGSTIGTTDFRQVVEQHPDIPALITNAEIRKTSDAYCKLLRASESYRKALQLVSKTAAEFGEALGACADCPGSAEGLDSASGLYLLIANHQEVLATSITNAFERPARQTIEKFTRTAQEKEAQFRIELRYRNRVLREHESQIQRMSGRARRTTRDLGSYRNSLLDLTAKIDDIDRLKYAHFQDAYRIAHEASEEVFSSVAATVRAHLEISEGIARKGWSGGGLEEIAAVGPDPFAVNEMDEEEATMESNGGAQTSKGKKSTGGSGHHGIDGVSASGNGSANIFSVLPQGSILPIRKADEEEDEEEAEAQEVEGAGRKATAEGDMTATEESAHGSGDGNQTEDRDDKPPSSDERPKTDDNNQENQPPS